MTEVVTIVWLVAAILYTRTVEEDELQGPVDGSQDRRLSRFGGLSLLISAGLLSLEALGLALTPGLGVVLVGFVGVGLAPFLSTTIHQWVGPPVTRSPSPFRGAQH